MDGECGPGHGPHTAETQTPFSQTLSKWWCPVSLESPSGCPHSSLPLLVSQSNISISTGLCSHRNTAITQNWPGLWLIGKQAVRRIEEYQWNISSWKPDQDFSVCWQFSERNTNYWASKYSKLYKIIVRLESPAKTSCTELFPRKLEECVYAWETFLSFRTPTPASSSGSVGEMWGWIQFRYSLSFKGIWRQGMPGECCRACAPMCFPVWHQTSSLVWATEAALPRGDSLITVFLPPLLWSGCKTTHCWTWAIPRNWLSEIFERVIYLGVSFTGSLHNCLYNSEATEYFHSK